MKKHIIVIVFVLAAAMVFASGGQQSRGSSASNAPAEISVEVFDRGTDGGRSDPTNNNWTKWIQEKLLKEENIKVSFVAVPRSEEVPGLNNLMAAGTAPDICFTYNENLIKSYRGMNGLVDMTPYIETLMPDLKKWLGEDSAVPGHDLISRYKDSSGRVYYIPTRVIPHFRDNTFMRKDWLDKLGLPLPSTTEEFYNALVAIKNQDPGNIGKDRVIPSLLPGRNTVFSFVDPRVTAKDIWVNDVVTDTSFYPLLPGYKEGYRFLNKLYNEGLIDPDFPIRKGNDNDNLLKAGLVGAFAGNWEQPWRSTPGIFAEYQKNIPGAEFVVVDPFKNAAGKTIKPANTSGGIMWFIPRTSKNPEAAMRYANRLSRSENLTFMQFGPAGTVHDIVNGLPKIKAAQGLWIQNSTSNLDYLFMLNGVFYNDLETSKKVLFDSYVGVPQVLLSNAYNTAQKDLWTVPYVQADLTLAGQYEQTLREKMTNMQTLAVTAKPGTFDKVWDDNLADWLASGAQAVINERSEKYVAP